MSYRFERLKSILSEMLPNTKTVIELNHIIKGYSVYLRKESQEIYIEIPANDLVTHYLNPPPSSLVDLYEETKRILRRLTHATT
jgi:hypothetical protein